MTNFDPLRWATHPRSPLALHAVIDGAHDGISALATIHQSLISDGICSESGRLLLAWNGNNFVEYHP